MVLTSESFKREERPMPHKPKGERVVTLDEFKDAEPALLRHLEAHAGNGYPLVVADKDGKMPSGVVVCVRVERGLIAYDADGSGRRLEEVDLAAVKGAKPEAAKKKKATRKKSAKPATDLDAPPAFE